MRRIATVEDLLIPRVLRPMLERFAGGAVASWVAGLLYDGTARGLSLVVAAGLVGVAASIRLIVLPREGRDPDSSLV